MRAMFMLFLILIGCGGDDPPADIDAPPEQVDAPAACAKPPVFLNMLSSGPETFQPSPQDDARTNRSRMLQTAATVMPMQGDTTAVVAATRAILEPLGIVVTDVDPGATPHIEIVVVGDPWPFQSGFAALGPGNCTVMPNTVGMINEFPGRTPADLAVSAAFLLGVMSGLEYSVASDNCMALSVGNMCTFSTTSPVMTPARCPGAGATQDQIALLVAGFGC